MAFLSRFGERPEFEPVMNSVFSGASWRNAFVPTFDFETRKRRLLDLFIDELKKRVPYVRAFEITPAHEAGGNTYHLVFGTRTAGHEIRREAL